MYAASGSKGAVVAEYKSSGSGFDMILACWDPSSKLVAWMASDGRLVVLLITSQHNHLHVWLGGFENLPREKIVCGCGVVWRGVCGAAFRSFLLRGGLFRVALRRATL